MNTDVSETTKPFDCGTVPHPARGDGDVQAFGSWQAAIRHLCDHVLTPPESTAWAILLPQAEFIVELHDADACWRYAREAFLSSGRHAQPLYDLYRDAVAADCRDARSLKWYACLGSLAVAMGTSGIIVVIDKFLRTAFLGGQGHPQATRRSQQTADGAPTHAPSRLSAADLSATALRRQWGMRAPKTDHPNRKERDRIQRLKRWPVEKQIYYLSFKPSLQFVKQCHHRCRDVTGELIAKDYALLKTVLPARKQLKYDSWLLVRRRCREDPR